MGASVVDGEGRRVGNVTDVRLVQDGPYVEGFGDMLRVDSLVVGRGGVASRLGYVRGAVRGPWLLRRLASVFEGRAWLIPWTDLEAGPDGFTLRTGREHLRRLRHVYDSP